MFLYSIDILHFKLFEFFFQLYFSIFLYHIFQVSYDVALCSNFLKDTY
jgi:hypothetical protein